MCTTPCVSSEQLYSLELSEKGSYNVGVPTPHISKRNKKKNQHSSLEKLDLYIVDYLHFEARNLPCFVNFRLDRARHRIGICNFLY